MSNMDGAVRFYLAEQAPFNLNLLRSASFRSEDTSPLCANSSDIAINSIRTVDILQDATHEQLLNEIVSAFQNRTFYMYLELIRQRKTKNIHNADPGTNVTLGTNKTKCQIVVHKNYKKEETFILKAELFDLCHHQYDKRSQLTTYREDDTRIKTQEMRITFSTNHEIRFVDSSYNYNIENLLTTGSGFISGKINLFLFAKSY